MIQFKNYENSNGVVKVFLFDPKYLTEFNAELHANFAVRMTEVSPGVEVFSHHEVQVDVGGDWFVINPGTPLVVDGSGVFVTSIEDIEFNYVEV